jgi:hypothetical protein
MDWTDRLKDWAEDAVDDGGGAGIFDKVGDFLGDQIDGSWAQDVVDAGTDGVIDKLDGDGESAGRRSPTRLEWTAQRACLDRARR